MRKLTALTVAFSLSAAGQALAGPPHAPAAHAPAAHSPAAAPAAHADVETGSPLEKQMHRQEILTQVETTAKSIAVSRPQGVLNLVGK